MARYKAYDLNQTMTIPLSYADQIIEGSFEYALNEVVERRLDLSIFEPRYHNNETGRPAYDPKVLLKVVLYGYYHGIISSRRIADACRRNVVFMVLSANCRPHFTTIAAFISGLKDEIASLFGDVLIYASELGLIGKEHFAIDGCKLPSNASKKWSGTHKELEEKCTKLERIAELIVQRHRERDIQERESGATISEPEKAQRYRRKAAELRTFLQQNAKKLGPTGNEQKSNLTDPESAKMATSRGVLQGYNGLAVVDDRSQVVVYAEAHGSGYEAHLLAHLIERTRESFPSLKLSKDVFAEAKVTADSGFHSKVVVAAVEATGADAYIADRDYRRRDPAFVGVAKYKQRDKKERALQRRKEHETRKEAESRLFTAKDFLYDEQNARCICPAGQKLYRSGKNMLFNGYRVDRFKAPLTGYRECHLRAQCLRYPDRTRQRQLAIIKHREGPPPRRRDKRDGPSQRMRWKFDTPFGRELYSRRMGTVEPVFANLQNKGMRRFMLRTQAKVSTQWKLFTIVHNIEKVAGAVPLHRRKRHPEPLVNSVSPVGTSLSKIG
ncbi:MAG: transposase [Polyangiaceae bacterium]